MSDLNRRIEAMYNRDVLIAWAFVVGLWLTVVFVMLATWDLMPPGPWRIVLLFGGAAVLLFNTAWISALVRHYQQDNEFISGLGNKHPDDQLARDRVRHRNADAVRAT